MRGAYTLSPSLNLLKISPWWAFTRSVPFLAGINNDTAVKTTIRAQHKSIITIPTFTSVREFGFGFALVNAVAPEMISPMALAIKTCSAAKIQS
jgi:hypothetical protein